MRGDEALRRSYLQCIAPNPPMVRPHTRPDRSLWSSLYLVRCVALYLLVHGTLFA